MFKTISLAFAFSLFAVSAFAAAPAFEEVDTDKSGDVSVEEAAVVGIGADLFAELDVDQNGALSMDEYKAIK